MKTKKIRFIIRLVFHIKIQLVFIYRTSLLIMTRLGEKIIYGNSSNFNRHADLEAAKQFKMYSQIKFLHKISRCIITVLHFNFFLL